MRIPVPSLHRVAPAGADASPSPDQLRREQFIDDLARRAARAHVTAPAILFLEMHKPLAFLGAQMLWAAQPFLGVWWDPADVHAVARLLEDPESVEALIRRLESTERPAAQP